MKGIIYSARNKKNGKRYIGQTIHSLEKRIRVHFSNNSNCPYFHRAIEKYDRQDWEWSIIDKANTREDLDRKERFWISFFESNIPEKGYNISSGGQGLSAPKTNEQKQKVRASMLRAVSNNYPKKGVNIKPIKCLETGKGYLSISQASRETNITPEAIRRSIKEGPSEKREYNWILLTGEERLRFLPNAIYCVELDKIYDNIRHARTEDRFHEGNLSKAMSSGLPDEPKTYAGYTFYWINPDYHCGTR